MLAIAQPELAPVVLEFCTGGAGQAALFDVVKSLTVESLGAATGKDIPSDAASGACFRESSMMSVEID